MSPAQGSLDVVVASTGLKVYGEGERKVCQHGVGKRRTWRKLHLAVDPDTHEIVAEAALDRFAQAWDAKYPTIAKV